MSGADVRSVLIDYGEGHELRTEGYIFNIVVNSASGLLRGHGQLRKGSLDARVDYTAGNRRVDLARIGGSGEAHVRHQGQEGQAEKNRCIHVGQCGLDGPSMFLLFSLAVELSV